MTDVTRYTKVVTVGEGDPCGVYNLARACRAIELDLREESEGVELFQERTSEDDPKRYMME